MFSWSKVCLLILPISFLHIFISIVVKWSIKFFLWTFKVIKELLVPLTRILSKYLPLLRFWYLVCDLCSNIVGFFCSVVQMSFPKNLSYLLLFTLCILDTLSAGVSISSIVIEVIRTVFNFITSLWKKF